ncbi:MAG: hypothetical protein COA62_04625 [Rhodobiaceae bacterium]|nr:MAG: hypothetical protein COA62_04625 [Rhodobiaceae bacterium]
MLTKGDEYPIHQTPEPIAYSGTDRNFYDRYFFNGYNKDGSIFFAAALGVYPHVNVMDASFCVVHNGVQHNVHASRILHNERMDTRVGPIAVEILEPLKSVRVLVDDNEYGIRADLTFHSRAPAIEEPRFIRRNNSRAMMDVTRMTQNVTWEGWIEVKGERIEVTRDSFVGTRDRSWGVRPIGAQDAQSVVPAQEGQFYWIWAPLNFDDCITLYHVNTDAAGAPWNTAAVICGLGDDAAAEHTRSCWSKLVFQSGTRFAKSAVIEMENHRREKTFIELTPKWNFYMMGLGYMNPEWGHGGFKGELAVGYESFRTDEITSAEPPFLHIQAFVEAKMTLPNGEVKMGSGILEQLVIGKHEPSGFKELLDMAP